MNKLIAIIAMTVFVAGCDINPVKPESRAYKQVEYVVRVPPKEMITLPKAPAPIDVEKADQADVADWLLQKEKYTRSLENIIQSVAEFLVDEQKKANDKAAEENAAAKAEAYKYDVEAGERADKKDVKTHVVPSR